MTTSTPNADDDIAETPTILPTRTELFSDAVFAIAITLLVIEIKVPEGGTNLLGQLLDLWPNYVGYVLSFALIGQVWLNHHAMFQRLKSLDHWTTICNLALLLDVAFLPFPTAVLAQALRTGEGTTVAAVFYGLVMVIGGIFFNAVWWSARRGGHLKDDTTRLEITTITRRFALGPLLYGVATALGLINAWLSIATYIVLIGFFMMENRPHRTKTHQF